MRLIGYGIAYPAVGASVSSFRFGPEWDRLVTFWVSFCHLAHDGALLAALCFLVMFGSRAASCFELLCAGVEKHCKGLLICAPADIVLRTTMLKFEQASLLGQAELIQMFVQLKTAFGIYGDVGGAFAFALVVDMGTWIFFLACTVLFRRGSLFLPLIFAIAAFQAVKAILVLVTIAELGHQLASKVQLEKTK